MLEKSLPDLNTYHFGEVAFKKLMQTRIYKVLIVCSNYDYYLLEQDGRIDEQIFNEYVDLNLRYPPSFLHANTGKSAISILKKDNIDLVITWLDAGNNHSFEAAAIIKGKFPNIPLAALTHYSNELRDRLDTEDTSAIDYVFHWSGNVDIFLAIIKLTEDSMNAETDINEIGVQAILLVEDSLRFYSNYLPSIYKMIMKQTRSFMVEGLNEHRTMILMRGRPKILLATNYEQGVELFEKYKHNLLGVISDVSYFKDGVKDSKAGFKFADHVRKENKYFPFLLQSSEKKNGLIAKEYGIEFLHKHSEHLKIELKRFIVKDFSFGKFEFWNPTTKKIIERASNLKGLQKMISVVPMESLVYHVKRNHFSKWLKSRALFPIANLFSQLSYEDFDNEHDANNVRAFLVNAIKSCRIFRARGVIAKFNKDQYDEYLGFSRIGEGALGGKGRGLAFIDNFLKRHKIFDKYEGVSISIPRTVVLSTEVYDDFMELNNLYDYAYSDDFSDEEMLNKFVSAEFPQWVLEDLKAFLKYSDRPLAVRSSSVLEDSHYQPFAGVFATYMIPNVENDEEKMLDMVCKAAKSVIASAFYKDSKTYIKATSHRLDEGKMAVILQEVTGKQYDDVYYPNLSGVARSINFYPIGGEKAKEGIANIAMGLGEIIVGGGNTIRFSPYHPKKVLQLSSPESAQRQSQKHFYALDLNPDSYKQSVSESVNKKRIRLKKAEKHGSLKFVASTYDLQNNMIRPGVNYDGLRVITFDNILKYNQFPLSDILKDLLRIGQREMRNPIEIEFAVNLDVPKGKNKVFSFLQIRPIVESNDVTNIIPDNLKEDDCIVYSESALGNGKYDNIKDFVYVKPESFNSAETRNIADAVDNINKKFTEEGNKYILVGPGRWGSSDPWLGVPVSWANISAAKIIVESGLNDFRIDPSQGTHFFQNLTSFKVGYLTINPFIKDGIYDIDYLNNQPAVYEDEYIRHVKFKQPLTIIIEGRANKAMILKEGVQVVKDVEDENNEEVFM
ncbi:MAG: phosphoenolpyruvate synthase [Ichthyobacteriaceae bacterium]|nr:phosphoenolpyruvate synthase [Ichthyobacteriaceae bacterium]